MATRSRILVVDSDPLSADLVEGYLISSGYDVIVLNNGEDVLNNIFLYKIDLVLLAIMLPGIDGVEVCRLIREKCQKWIPIIFLTKINEIKTKVISFETGADDFLTKPCHKDELLARIKAHLRIRTLLEEVDDLNRTLEFKVVERTEFIQNLNENIRDAYHLMLDSLIGVLDVREHEVSQHSLRVAYFTVELAKSWGITTKELEEIAIGALLHDVGKIGISDKVLLKPGKLTEEEWVEMRNHVNLSWKIVKDIEFMGKGRDLVYAHHERFDGTGYPRGLKNEEIYIGARFFTVADTLDAMTSDRTYRKAMSFEEFLKELKLCSGTQFDPKVVDVFLAIDRKVWFKAAQQADIVDFNKLVLEIQQEKFRFFNN